MPFPHAVTEEQWSNFLQLMMSGTVEESAMVIERYFVPAEDFSMRMDGITRRWDEFEFWMKEIRPTLRFQVLGINNFICDTSGPETKLMWSVLPLTEDHGPDADLTRYRKESCAAALLDSKRSGKIRTFSSVNRDMDFYGVEKLFGSPFRTVSHMSHRWNGKTYRKMLEDVYQGPAGGDYDALFRANFTPDFVFRQDGNERDFASAVEWRAALQKVSVYKVLDVNFFAVSTASNSIGCAYFLIYEDLRLLTGGLEKVWVKAEAMEIATVDPSSGLISHIACHFREMAEDEPFWHFPAARTS